MENEVIRVDDSNGEKKSPIAIKREPLLYSLHIKEKWTPYPGTPVTPLPEGWSWFKAEPDFKEADVADLHDMLGLRKDQITWNIALDENLRPKDISIEEIETNGYVWEDATIKLHLKGYKAPFLCAPYPCRTFEPFEDKQYVTHSLDVTLETYGCTNLRITYFPIADLK